MPGWIMGETMILPPAPARCVECGTLSLHAGPRVASVKGSAVYVEIRIHGDLEELWRLTQTPELHERWDLRFSEIQYLPRPDAAQPQRFLYATRIGWGMRIVGGGESVGENNGSAGRTSALRFWSTDPRSLIREGSGYWRYVPTDDGVRFLTRYDYQSRFGSAGAAFDKIVFRPLMGWATAWSFDRLRLWIERGIDPAVAMQRSLIHAIARTSLAFIWIYQGLIPKLVFRQSSGELDTVRGFGLTAGLAGQALTFVACIELLFGASLVLLWRARSLFLINIAALVILGFVAFMSDRRLFIGQFNPATLNSAMIALGVVGWLAAQDLPTARNCLRREPERPPEQ